MKKVISLLLALALVIQPLGGGIIKAEDGEAVIQAYENKLVPADGKTLLFIGQDDDEVADYISAVEDYTLSHPESEQNITSIPAGMMIYTNISDLSGMTSAFQGEGANQAGKMDFQEWTTKYENTALSIGIWTSGTALLQGIQNGEYDDNIKKLASFMKASDKPIYVRFGYEFDGPWNTYPPALYKKAYQHFVDVIRDTTISGESHYGAGNNISFVWHSAAFFRLGESAIWPGSTYDKSKVEAYLANPLLTLEDWYPGDEYVDWVGISWFAWDHKFQEDAAQCRRNEAVAFAKQHNKPVMIAEAAPKANWQPNEPTKGCCDDGRECIVGETDFTHQGDSWENWYQPLFDYIEANDIKALCYINQDWDAQEMWRLEGGWGNSRVQENEKIFAKWLTKLSDSRYLMCSDALYAQIGFTPVNKTQDVTSGLKVTDYSAKADNGSGWCIQGYPGFISFQGQYVWAEYHIRVMEPGYYDVIYDYVSGMAQGTDLNVFVNGVQQGTTASLPLTDSGWAKSQTVKGQLLYFDYAGNYTLLLQSPSAGLYLKRVSFEKTEPAAEPGVIYIYGKENLSTESQNITVSYGAFASFGVPSKAVYHFEAEVAGNYQILYNYGTTVNSKYKVYVDGNLVEDSVMEATGDWTRWREKQGVYVYLDKGTHTIALEAPDGSLNLQYIKFMLDEKQVEENGSGTETGQNTVNKKAQTIITKKSSYHKAKGSKAFYLGAKAQTKLFYKSSNSKVATVNGKGKVRVKGYGRTTITITAAESTNYKRAVKKVTITVTPKSIKKFSIMQIQKKRRKKVFQIKWKKMPQ